MGIFSINYKQFCRIDFLLLFSVKLSSVILLYLHACSQLANNSMNNYWCLPNLRLWNVIRFHTVSNHWIFFLRSIYKSHCFQTIVDSLGMSKVVSGHSPIKSFDRKPLLKYKHSGKCNFNFKMIGLLQINDDILISKVTFTSTLKNVYNI